MSVCILSEIKVTRNPTVSLHFPFSADLQSYSHCIWAGMFSSDIVSNIAISIGHS